MERWPTVVLGAGGMVSQRLQQRLAHHPWFSLAAVAGSSRFNGRSLAEVPWILDEARPDLPVLTVVDVEDEDLMARLAREGVRIAFSALPAGEAERLEPRWASHGIAVFSNASAFRRHPGIPLVIPELNPEALSMAAGKPHRHVCATNCTLLPLALPFAALNDTYAITNFTMRSEQGLSGGGFGYMQEALERGDVDPTIPGEAEKTEAELRHVLGWTGSAEVRCGRVMRADGHHVFVTVETEKPMTAEDATACLVRWSSQHIMSELPSAPHQPLMLVDRIDPGTHLHADGRQFEAFDSAHHLSTGMAITVGNIVCETPHRLRFEGFSHNTLRGAAGGVIYLAELARFLEAI